MARLAVLAFGGALPAEIARAHPGALKIGFAGIGNDLGRVDETHELEKLGRLFKALKAGGVTQVVLAGGLTRPQLNPAALDLVTMKLAPGVMKAMQNGDDGLLRHIIGLFEARGFQVVGAHELLPDLPASAGLAFGAEPGQGDLADAARGQEILAALSPLDIGQGCIVAGGQCLGIETIQGTNALLSFAAQTPDRYRKSGKGVFVKAAKRGQDLRVDMPVIGPHTVALASEAGLAGIMVQAGRVMILERAAVEAAVHEAGLFLIAQGF